MLISVITVAYNSADTIRDTLESVCRQTYPHVEHIVVDGASTDGTCDIVRAYGHVARWVSEPDGGAYEAMNKGIALARGEIIGFLNADDCYASRYALQWVAHALKHGGTDVLYADLCYVRRYDLGRIVRYWRSGVFRPERFRYGWMPPHPTFFTYKKYYETLGGYDTRLRLAADYELMLRFLYKHRLSAFYLPEVLVHMRTGGMSNASLMHRWRANREDRLAWEINGLNPGFFTPYLKPLRKVFQFWPLFFPGRVRRPLER